MFVTNSDALSITVTGIDYHTKTFSVEYVRSPMPDNSFGKFVKEVIDVLDAFIGYMIEVKFGSD